MLGEQSGEKDAPRLRTNGDVWAEHGHAGWPCSPPEAVRDVVPCRIGEQSAENDTRTEALLAEAQRAGVKPHKYVGIGHMIHPDDMIDCCRFGVLHPIHTRVIPPEVTP